MLTLFQTHLDSSVRIICKYTCWVGLQLSNILVIGSLLKNPLINWIKEVWVGEKAGPFGGDGGVNVTTLSVWTTQTSLKMKTCPGRTSAHPTQEKISSLLLLSFNSSIFPLLQPNICTSSSSVCGRQAQCATSTVVCSYYCALSFTFKSAITQSRENSSIICNDITRGIVSSLMLSAWTRVAPAVLRFHWFSGQY